MTVSVSVEPGANYPGGPQDVSYDELTATLAKLGGLSEKTAAAGIELNHLLFADIGSAAGAAALGFGKTKAEGLQAKVIEETLDLTGLAAKFKAMTTAIPTGAVIVSAQVNVEATVVAGGTTVKVALGLNAGDVDKYGLGAALTQNTKITKVPDWAVLSGNEQIDVCGVISDGSALGDTNISAGSVRVRVVYLQAANLANAA